MLSLCQKSFISDFKKYISQKDIFILAGGAGSGKSFVCLLLLHYLALEFAGVRFGVFRKSRSILKQNTIPSYLKMLHQSDTLKSAEVADFRAKYENGSEILFLWCDPSKDPDNNNIKGLELTGALFEEFNQLDKDTFHTVRSRVGRWNEPTSVISGRKIVLPPFVLANCNPNNTWVKHDFYDPYIEGNLPKNVYFHQSVTGDNPYLDENYLKTLKSLPEEQKQRYLENSWHYNDNPNALVSLEDYIRSVKAAK